MNYTAFKKTIIIITTMAMIVIINGCLSSSPQNTDSGLTTTQKPISVVPSSSPIPTTGQPTTGVLTDVPTIPPECVVAAKGAGAYLRTISDENQSLPDILINVTPIAVQCSLRDPTYTNVTNSTGWAYLGSLPANYEFDTSLTYQGKDYNLSIPQEPLYKTYATLKLPSGNLTINVCTSEETEVCKSYN